MAAITHAVSTASTSNAASYVSGSFTPAAGDVLIAFVTATNTLATGTMTSSVAGQTFTKVTSAVFNSSQHTVYCFILNNFTTAVSQTVTFGCSGDNATGAVVQVARIAGLSRTGLGAIKQFATLANQSPGTPAPAFTASVQTDNPTFGVVGCHTNPATITAPTGWTELNDAGYNTPPTGAEYVGRDSGFTGTTVTWGSAAATDFASLIVEVDVTKQPQEVSLPAPARKHSVVAHVILNTLLTTILVDAPVQAVPRLPVAFAPQHRPAVVVPPPENLCNTLFYPLTGDTFKNDISNQVWKKHLTGEITNQNNFVLFLVPPGAPTSAPQFSTVHLKREVSPNLFPGRGSNAQAPAEEATGTPFPSFGIERVSKQHLGTIYLPPRGINAGAPNDTPASGIPFVPPLFEYAYQKKIVYNIPHWNAQGSQLDFEPIAASVPESLEPQKRKWRYADTSQNSRNVNLLGSLSQTFTFTPSGGVVFSGTNVFLQDKVISAGGTLTFSGEATTSHTINYELSGAITFSGTTVIQFLPEGSTVSTTKLPMTGAGQT
jgi:hypothetical protein